MENTQSFELATALAGQIARAAAVFRVDEIVVFEVCVCSTCSCMLGCDLLRQRDEADRVAHRNACDLTLNLSFLAELIASVLESAGRNDEWRDEVA